MEEKCLKNGEITISGQISETCTGTGDAVAKLYRYSLDLYRYSPPESNLYGYNSELYRYRWSLQPLFLLFLRI